MRLQVPELLEKTSLEAEPSVKMALALSADVLSKVSVPAVVICPDVDTVTEGHTDKHLHTWLTGS